MVTVGGTRSVGSCWQGSYRLQLRGGDSQEVWMSMGKQRVCKGEMVVQKYFGESMSREETICEGRKTG